MNKHTEHYKRIRDIFTLRDKDAIEEVDESEEDLSEEFESEE